MVTLSRSEIDAKKAPDGAFRVIVNLPLVTTCLDSSLAVNKRWSL